MFERDSRYMVLFVRKQVITFRILLSGDVSSQIFDRKIRGAFICIARLYCNRYIDNRWCTLISSCDNI